MISASELQRLQGFIAAHRDGGLSPLDRLWAGRCAALLAERERLTERLEVLVREVDARLGRAGPPRMTRGSFDGSLGPFLAAVVRHTHCQEARRGALCHVHVFGRRVTDEEAFLDAVTDHLAMGPAACQLRADTARMLLRLKKNAPLEGAFSGPHSWPEPGYRWCPR